MPIPVKIECPCGQRYSFDAEPVNGRMAFAIACPVCNVDGTSAADAIISRHFQPPMEMAAATSTAEAPTSGARLQVSKSAAAVEAPARPKNSSVGLMDPAKTEIEAKSKILWGDPPEEVVKFLMLHGFTVPAAKELVNKLFEERVVALRKVGVNKIFTGIGLICVPVVALMVFMYYKVIILSIFALTCAVGLWGFFRLLKGIMMVVAPKIETGDVYET